VDPQSYKGQKVAVKLASREVTLATKLGLKGAAEGSKILAATATASGKEAMEELTKEENQERLRVAKASALRKKEAMEASVIPVIVPAGQIVKEKGAALIELSTAKASEAATWIAAERSGSGGGTAAGGAGGGGGGATQQTRMAIVHDSFDPNDPNDMVPFQSTMPTVETSPRAAAAAGGGGGTLGPIEVSAGCVVKVVDDVCGNHCNGEWWHIIVPSTGAEGYIPAAIAISTASGGSGEWSSI
jgi:hypothetical protein